MRSTIGGRARLAVFGATVVASAFVACGGLLVDPDDSFSVAPNGDGGHDASRHDAAITDGSPSTADAGPRFNDDGWIALQGFEPACNVFVAPSPSAAGFPPPIAWEPCNPPVLVASDTDAGATLDCRQMANDFGGTPPAGYTSVFGFALGGFVDRSSQRAILAFQRIIGGDHVVVLAADADGPVHQAFTIGPGRCGLGLYGSLTTGHSLYRVVDYGLDGLHEIASALIGGPLDGMVSVLHTEVDAGGELNPLAAGTTVFADWRYYTGTHVARWSDPSSFESWTTSNSELVFQDDVLFTSNQDFLTSISATTASGEVTLVSAGNATSTATDFGTDGVDMVWTEGRDEQGYEGPFTTIDTMTAPYTTDPGAVVKRRLRSETTQPGDRAFAVGCGYAAHPYSEVSGAGLRIVRVADGRSWRIDTHTADLVLGITCTEIFVGFGEENARIGRIRLDSLGPGEAPN
ncbi:MAG TPA: hypothetical protein VF407_18670 [Polyangiaceae bacterium]